MPDHVPGIGKYAARLLPRAAAERVFLPAYYDLHAAHLDACLRCRGLALRRAALAFFVHTAVIALECGAIAISDAWNTRRRGVEIFGFVPAIYASRPDVAGFLKEARRDGASSGRGRFRSALVALEVALALMLLAGAGLTMRSFERLSRVDPGFDPSDLLSAGISLGEARYPTTQAVALFYQRYVDALSAQPGVVSAGAVMRPPLARGGLGGTFSIIGRADPDESLQVRPATPGYLETLRIPLRRGRLLTAADREGSPPVAVISETTARQFWPGQDPVGRRIRIHVSTGTREREREIIGVVGDVKIRALNVATVPVVYVPLAQYVSDSMTVFVRASADPLSLTSMLRSQLSAIDSELAPANIRTGERIVAASVAEQRFRMVLLGLFAAIALVLAAVGLYGVMAFSVTERRSELGVRIALGADAGDLLRLVLRQGLTPVAIGIVAGLAGAAVLTRSMAELLFEVGPFDPVTFAAVSVLLTVVAAIACYIPARRATTVDPITAMRH